MTHTHTTAYGLAVAVAAAVAAVHMPQCVMLGTSASAYTTVDSTQHLLTWHYACTAMGVDAHQHSAAAATAIVVAVVRYCSKVGWLHKGQCGVSASVMPLSVCAACMHAPNRDSHTYSQQQQR
eukprot:15784-Heterococcus_DN1.PRE.2